MKKENMIMKTLMKALIGFPIGVSLLLVTYASVYFMADVDTFNTELYQLHNINILIYQTISAGISGYILFVTSYLITLLQDRFLIEHPYKSVFIMILSLNFLPISILVFGNKQIFSENISILSMVLIVLVFALNTLIFYIKNGIERYWIKKINNKIKEKNIK